VPAVVAFFVVVFDAIAAVAAEFTICGASAIVSAIIFAFVAFLVSFWFTISTDGDFLAVFAAS